jgi:hypothetical protein
MFSISQDFESCAYTCLLYGPAGVGKTSFATWAESPLVFNLENGLKGIDLKTRDSFATSQIEDWASFIEGLEMFETQDKFKTAIVDTASKLEEMMVEHVCKTGKKETLADFAFGKGYEQFNNVANKLCQSMDRLKSAGKNVILIAHERVETFQDPENDAYDRFNCSLNKRIAAKIKANVDHIFYMFPEKVIKELASGKNTAKFRGRTLIQTKETGGVVCKTRGERPLFIEVRNDQSAREIWASL